MKHEAECTQPSPEQSDQFERELLNGADEILRRTNEAEEQTMSVSRTEMELDREAVIQLHETKDEQDDGPWGLMPLAILLGLVGMAFVAIVVLKICGVL